jgi:hypothetical protein
VQVGDNLLSIDGILVEHMPMHEMTVKMLFPCHHDDPVIEMSPSEKHGMEF